jgi:hypothetical protein
VAAPSILNTGRREKEQELIWRGNQYVRGIRLYYQKNGRYPQNREELVKGTLGVHFVRKQFADPVANQGGDWRFIYVSPAGQLTGSVRYHTLQEMAAALGAGVNIGGPPGSAAPGTTGAVGTGGAPGATGQSGTGAGSGVFAGSGGAAPGTSQGQPGSQSNAANPAAAASGGLTPAGMGLTQTPLQAVDGPVLGGSLVGVASKVKKDSLMVYQGKENYFQWEFIFNPLLNRGPGGMQAGQLPGTPGAPAQGGAPGLAPPGIGPGGAQPGATPNNGMPPMPGVGGGVGATQGPGSGGAGAFRP